jgi:hypothetical protein
MIIGIILKFLKLKFLLLLKIMRIDIFIEGILLLQSNEFFSLLSFIFKLF